MFGLAEKFIPPPPKLTAKPSSAAILIAFPDKLRKPLHGAYKWFRGFERAKKTEIKDMISRLDRSLIWVFAFFLILFTTSGSFGQQVVVNRDADGNWQGPYASFHPNGAKMVEATFKDGRLTGKYSAYHATGQLAMQGMCYGSRFNSNDAGHPLKTGLWTEYFPDGKKSGDYQYDQNNRDGKTIQYHGNGKPAIEVTFKAGIMTGTYSKYHVNGQLAMQGTTYGDRFLPNSTDHPLKTGLWTEYFPDGKKSGEYQYVKNTLDGQTIEYHPNGKKHIEATFKADQLTGTYSEYHSTGQLALQGATYGCKYDAGRADDPLRTGLWITYNLQGAVTEATLFVKDRAVSKASYSTDTATGQTTIVATNPDGTRTVVKVDKNGLVETPKPPNPTTTVSIGDAPDIIGMQTDAVTGQTTTSRRNPDGSTTTYTGRRERIADGTERLTEIDDKGNKIVTAVAPDGTITETRSRPGKGETRTTTTPDGRVTTVDRDVAGRTRTSTLADDGSVVSTIRNSDGEVTGTTRQRPDGWVEQSDSKGNSRRILRDPSGTTTTITTDASGNVTTTVVGKDGKVAERDANTIALREPGRAYYEQTLNGSNWDDLSPRLRNQMANSERQMQASQVKRAEEDAAEVRRKTEEARLAAQGANATEESKKRYEKMRADQEAADRAAAALKAKFAKRNELEAAYQTGRTLDRDYRAAVDRGDKTEAARIQKLQDANTQKYATLLEQSPEEQRAIDQYSDARSKISNEINARAYAAAERTIESDAALQRAKEGVTAVTEYVSVGSQMQQSTAAATRAANREKVQAQAKLREIDRDLNDPATTPERRSILQDMREMAVLQEDGATELLTSNAQITAAGYVIDGALALTGAKLGQLGYKAGVSTVGKVVGRRTVTQVATERIVSRAGDITRIVGGDVLAGPVAARAPILEFTSAELRRLVTRGANLTGPEIIKKAELYLARETARNTARRAIENGASDAVLAPLQQQFRALNTLIEDAVRAANNLP